MGELKPIGSEKLKGDAKLKRILELTYYNSSDNSERTSEVIKESSTGVYGIVKEKDGYYVKRGLNENSLDYIGGLYMKNKNRFSAYGEALKKLEFLTEQENLQEATKYVLKRPKPAPQDEAPAPMPTNEPPAPAAAPDPTAMDTPDSVTPAPEDNLGGEDPSATPNDPVKVIQTKTGRLTQKLNQYKDELESEDIKYVLGMVLSAVDLDKMEETDKDEILAKLEGDEDSEEGSPEMGASVPEAGGEVGGMGSGETGGIDPITSLEELIDDDSFASDDFMPYDPDEDEEEMYDIGPDDYKAAAKAAHHDIEKDIEGMDDEPEDEIGGDFDQILDKDDTELDEMGSGDDLVDPNNFQNGETTRGDDVKEIDLDELTNMINGGVKETLSKYFN